MLLASNNFAQERIPRGSSYKVIVGHGVVLALAVIFENANPDIL